MTLFLSDRGPNSMLLLHEDTSAALKIAGLSHPCLYTRLAAISCDSIIKWSYHAGPSEGYIQWAAAPESKHPGGGMRRCFQRHHLMCSTAPVVQARRNPHSWAFCLPVGRIQTSNAKRVGSPRSQIRYPECSGRLYISCLGLQWHRTWSLINQCTFNTTNTVKNQKEMVSSTLKSIKF